MHQNVIIASPCSAMACKPLSRQLVNCSPMLADGNQKNTAAVDISHFSFKHLDSVLSQDLNSNFV